MLARADHAVTVVVRDHLVPAADVEAAAAGAFLDGLQIVQPHVLLPTFREVVRSGPDVFRGLMAAGVVEAPLLTQLPSSVADRSTRPSDEQLPLLMTRRATLGGVLCRAVAAEPGARVRHGVQVTELPPGRRPHRLVDPPACADHPPLPHHPTIHPAGDHPLNRLRRGTAERGRATPSSHLPVGGMMSIRSLADFEGAPGRHVERGVRTSQAVVVTLADGHADVMEPAATDPTRLIPYAGHVIRVLGECQGLAICELTVPPRFAGPPAHIHHDFDEAIYVLSGALTMTRGQADPEPAPAGTLILAPRGIRHTFANPTDEPVHVLGAWSPASALSFMEEIGAALPATGPPDPTQLAEIYRRHNSELAL